VQTASLTVALGSVLTTPTITYNGFISPDDETTAFSVLPSSAYPSTAAVGAFPILITPGVVSSGVGSNYSFIYQSGMLTVAIPVPAVITTTSLPDGIVGTSYRQVLTATGDAPITWRIESGVLPDGLSLNVTTGEISGTPATAGVVTFAAKASNSAGYDTKTLSINIMPTINIVDVSAPKLKIYPNPANDIVIISGLQGNEIITLVDATGRIRFIQQAKSAEERLAVGSLSGGLYFVRIADGDSVVVLKLVITDF
jgi:hypothetical protein